MDEKSVKPTDPARNRKRTRFEAKKGKDRRKLWLPWSIVAIAVVAAGVIGTMQLLPDSGEQVARISSSPNLSEPIETDGAAPVNAVAATQGHAVYPVVVEEVGSVLRFALSDFSDGTARYYTYMYGDQPIEIFVLESQDGVVRAAFNACDVCYEAKRGYTQSGDVMVCENCGRQFAANRINVEQGGCNPAPLERRIEGEYVVIDVDSIVRGARFF